MIRHRQRIMHVDTGETGVVIPPTPLERKQALRGIARNRYDAMRHLHLINWDNGDPTSWEHDAYLEVLS